MILQYSNPGNKNIHTGVQSVPELPIPTSTFTFNQVRVFKTPLADYVLSG